jgi:basic membrane protein A
MRRVAACIVVLALAAATGAATASDLPGATHRPRVVLISEPVGATASVWLLMTQGMRRAAKELDVDARVVTPSPRESYASVATRLAREGADLVIGGLALQGPGIVEAAERNPRTAFAVIDVDPIGTGTRWPPNANGLVFREEEVGYLVGHLAGLVERRRPGRDTLAAIGGMRMPPVDRFIAGFRAGVARTTPKARILLAYAGTFTDPERCARIAAAQVERGAGVVFPVAGWCGNGALDVARRLHVWGIGVDADQASLGPHILTSAVKRFDVAVLAAVRRLVAGTRPYGGTTSLGLREQALELGKVSPRVPRTLVARTLAVRDQIVAGDVAIPRTVSGRTPARGR